MHIKFFPRYLNIKAYAPGDNTLELLFFWNLHRLTNAAELDALFINEFDLYNEMNWKRKWQKTKEQRIQFTH